MCYEWETDLVPFVSTTKIEELRQLVKRKANKGQALKRLLITADIVFLVLLILLVGVLNLLKLVPDLRFGFINGVIAFTLAIIAFLSPIRTRASMITMEEVDTILGKMVTGDVFKKISQTVDKKASGTQKWLALISACGILAVLIIIEIAG